MAKSVIREVREYPNAKVAPRKVDEQIARMAQQYPDPTSGEPTGGHTNMDQYRSPTTGEPKTPTVPVDQSKILPKVDRR
jgi:hypothetical protein